MHPPAFAAEMFVLFTDAKWIARRFREFGSSEQETDRYNFIAPSKRKSWRLWGYEPAAVLPSHCPSFLLKAAMGSCATKIPLRFEQHHGCAHQWWPMLLVFAWLWRSFGACGWPEERGGNKIRERHPAKYWIQSTLSTRSALWFARDIIMYWQGSGQRPIT